MLNWQKQEQEPMYVIIWKGFTLELVSKQKYFCEKSFEDNEVPLPNVPKVVAIERTKSRQSGYKTLYPEVKLQSDIYPSWSNSNDHQLGSSYQFCDTDPENIR